MIKNGIPRCPECYGPDRFWGHHKYEPFWANKRIPLWVLVRWYLLRPFIRKMNLKGYPEL